MSQPTTVPARAWVVTGAGTAVNLCLGILYAWSIWKANLTAAGDAKPGDPMGGVNEGWTYLSDAEATWAYVVCGFTFALVMIPGGRLQDRYGPRVGATLAGVCLGAGCVFLRGGRVCLRAGCVCVRGGRVCVRGGQVEVQVHLKIGP